MRENKTMKKFVCGLMAAVMLACAMPAFATTGKKQMEVDYLDIKLVVDGKEVTPKDVNGNVVEPFVYNGTTYLPVRAVGEALGKTVLWDGETKTVYLGEMSQLTVTGTMEKAVTVEKTYGVNMNYYNPGNGGMNWASMPNLMAALEGKDWAIPNLDRPGLFQEGVFVYSTGSVSGASLTLAITYFYDSTGTNKVLKISGFDYIEGYVDQLPVIDGALKDLICDADRESINGLLNTISENTRDGYNAKTGATAEAIEWVKNQSKEYSFKEVKVSADEWLTDFTIITK